MLKDPILLGVNLDHIATLRQARLTRYPDPIEGVFIAEGAGADGITVHLREDRRHIQERDVELIKAVTNTRLNLEMATLPQMVQFAEKVKPEHVCLVPEKREELTTEGGLDVLSEMTKIAEITQQLKALGIQVSIFIDPDLKQIEAAIKCDAPAIEIHTGSYADATNDAAKKEEMRRIVKAAQFAHEGGLVVNAGHGLNYQNVQPIAQIPQINELNIGHGIISRAIFIGLHNAVSEMKRLMIEARST